MSTLENLNRLKDLLRLVHGTNRQFDFNSNGGGAGIGKRDL